MVLLFNRAGVNGRNSHDGDRAIDLVVDTYAAALTETPAVGLRHSVIHAHEPTQHAVAVNGRSAETIRRGNSRDPGGIPVGGWAIRFRVPSVTERSST